VTASDASSQAESRSHPRLNANTTFRSFARLNQHVASTLYGIGSTEADAVTAAWATVGVDL
jgi:Zn-dependent metalloprotease